MNRPLYESFNDLTNEQRVAANLSTLWKADFHKLPRSYHVDWMACRDNQTVAFAELKCRQNERLAYPTFMISLAKWMRGKELAKEAGVPFIIIVDWTDGTFFLKVQNQPVTYGFGGRKDRNDLQDMEPVVFIDTSYFMTTKVK